MSNLLRLLLLLLMGGSLLAARWANGLGKAAPTPVAVRTPGPVLPVAQQAWLPYGAWAGWVRPARHTARPEASSTPVRSL